MNGRGTWQGVAAIILALGITGTLLTFVIAGAVNPGRMTPVTADEASALTTVLGAAIGALAVYLGVGRSNGNGKYPAAPVADRARETLDAAAERARVEARPDPATAAEAERVAEGPAG